MAKIPTIAGVVLTLNEEKNLPRALESLHWCDEILVLDSGSTDQTQQIAESYHASFHIHIQEPPFLITDQRNWALHHCGLTSDWVLFLDADEEIGSLLSDKIIQEISKNTSVNSFELTPRYWFLGRWLKKTQGYPNWHPRLLKRTHVLFEGGVWESFSSQAIVSRIYVPYEHYAFSKGIDDWVYRHLRYSQWDAYEIQNYLSHNQLSTTRKFRLRKLDSLFWPLKPFTRFAYKYFFSLGCLEGWQSLLYCFLIAFYDLMVVIKIIELRRASRGLPL